MPEVQIPNIISVLGVAVEVAKWHNDPKPAPIRIGGYVWDLSAVTNSEEHHLQVQVKSHGKPHNNNNIALQIRYGFDDLTALGGVNEDIIEVLQGFPDIQEYFIDYITALNN